MTYLLQFCGVSDPLQLFYLEQSSVSQGPAFAGFRPFQLDALLEWALDTAQGRGWERDRIHSTVFEQLFHPCDGRMNKPYLNTALSHRRADDIEIYAR